jgi:hypothetical protein
MLSRFGSVLVVWFVNRVVLPICIGTTEKTRGAEQSFDLSAKCRDCELRVSVLSFSDSLVVGELRGAIHFW